MAFSELLACIVETQSNESPDILWLADMVSLYRQRLEQLGVATPNVN